MGCSSVLLVREMTQGYGPFVSFFTLGDFLEGGFEVSVLLNGVGADGVGAPVIFPADEAVASGRCGCDGYDIAVVETGASAHDCTPAGGIGIGAYGVGVIGLTDGVERGHILLDEDGAGGSGIGIIGPATEVEAGTRDYLYLDLLSYAVGVTVLIAAAVLYLYVEGFLID